MSIELRFHGVRGSYPICRADSLHFGGNTACVEMRVGGRTLLFDAGTGIIAAGKTLSEEANGRPMSLVLFLSHLHQDHIQGLPFFAPSYEAPIDLRIFGPQLPNGALSETLRGLTGSHLFPVELEQRRARHEIGELEGGQCVLWRAGEPRAEVLDGRAPVSADPRDLLVRVHRNYSHPRLGVLNFRIEHGGRTVVYATDVEGYAQGDVRLARFARDCDLLIHDAQYTPEEYSCPERSTQGWGHSTWEMAAEAGTLARARRLVLFHHDPSHDDAAVARIAELASERFEGECIAAYEGMSLTV